MYDGLYRVMENLRMRPGAQEAFQREGITAFNEELLKKKGAWPFLSAMYIVPWAMGYGLCKQAGSGSAWVWGSMHPLRCAVLFLVFLVVPLRLCALAF